MKLNKLFLLMIAAILSIGLVAIACGDDDDDDDNDDNDDATGDDDDNGSGDPVTECQNWYDDCGIDDAGYCDGLNGLDLTDSCISDAITNLFDCLSGTDCDAVGVSDCLITYGTEIQNCY
ncbi:MAG: hypothetical protein GX444_16090 [Myxococcales bacterium]|nr:hypothetical protein [Myxococcales bacterium]